MAWKSLGGTSRKYLNTETGEIISRRQFQKIKEGISFEAKAKKNKQENLKLALSRPAHGRKKVSSEFELEERLKAAQVKAESDRVNKLNRAAKLAAKKVKVKKIRPQLLKTGHRAVRLPFSTYEEFQDLRKQMLSVKLSNGKRLITAYSLGIVGFDERTGKELYAILVTLQSPKVNIKEDEFYDLTEDFLQDHLYFIFSHYFLHLHFDKEYAESRLKKSNRKNLPPNIRNKKGK